MRPRHRVTLRNPSAPVPDGDGGVAAQTWPAFAMRIPAVVEAVDGPTERPGPSGVQARAEHVVTIRYLTGVTTKTRVDWHARGGDRTLSVTGVTARDDKSKYLRLACVEAAI